MIINIQKEVVNKLDGLFPDTPIYCEDIKGAFEEQTFFIQQSLMSASLMLSGYQCQRYSFDIVYFPRRDAPKKDINRMIEILAHEFKSIDGICKCTDRDFTVLRTQPPDSELHFSFKLEIYVRHDIPDDFEGKLEFKGGLKYGN